MTKTYGRGSLLAFLSPLLADVAASRGLNGWERSAALAMEKDALAMQERGYRIALAEEDTLLIFGVAWLRVVYEPGESPGPD